MSEVKLALIVGENDENLQMVDVVKIQPLSPTVFILETTPFDNKCLENGAGKEFTKEQIMFYLKSLFPQ